MSTNGLSRNVAVGFFMAAVAAGCGDKGGAGADSASPKSSAQSSSKAADAKSADGPKKGTAKYEYDKANAIYKEIFDLKNMDPYEKKVEAMKTKLGAPDKTDGDKVIWYAVDKDSNCYEFSASPTKGSGYESTDKAKCGL